MRIRNLEAEAFVHNANGWTEECLKNLKTSLKSSTRRILVGRSVGASCNNMCKGSLSCCNNVCTDTENCAGADAGAFFTNIGAGILSGISDL